MSQEMDHRVRTRCKRLCDGEEQRRGGRGDEWHDDFLRPIPLQKLYRQFFQKSCIPPPNHPDKALSKLRGMEQRNSIYPDSITRFYMEQLQKNPPCRIIELLIMEGGDS